MVWIFGYGSLIHKPGFAFSDRVEGHIKGYRRVFHQGSTDHRGTPEAPGRTVTLKKELGSTTWGVAYKLAGDDDEQQQTLRYLEWREKQYDVRQEVDVYGLRDPDIPLVPGALVYIASEDTSKNVNYLGPAPEDTIALQIALAHGPSGPNYEYLYKLADAMREMEVQDEELFSLEAKVKMLRQELPTNVALTVGQQALLSATAHTIMANSTPLVTSTTGH